MLRFELNVVFIVTRMSGLMRNMTLSDEDDCLLMMCTRARLSICRIIFLFRSALAQMVNAKTMGTYS